MRFKNMLGMISRGSLSSFTTSKIPSSTALLAPAVDTPYVKLIDTAGDFTANDIDIEFKRWGLSSEGTDGCKIVTIFGWGYSDMTRSLLDELFGSNVVTNKGTKYGVWMCYIKSSKTLVFFTSNILLMDNGLLANFARFAVAVSDVLVIHSRCLAFERHSNDLTPLLRSIFIAHLQLFGQLHKSALAIMGRTLLLMIGYDPNPLPCPMETICSVHYTKVWQGIKSNPQGRAGFRQLVDYFDVDVVTIPEETRTQKIYQLRSQFSDSDNRDYVFKTRYHKHVIPEKLALSMEQLWHQLKATRSLIPREQEVVVSDLRSWVESGIKTILESPDDGLEESLLSLFLYQLRRANLQSGAPTAECIDLLFVLLGMKNYVHILLQIEAESDAELLLDLLLVVLDDRGLLSRKPNVPDAYRRVRRLMFKLATKVPVMPPSLRIAEMKVIPKYAGWGGFSDVFMGEYLGIPVALKLLRIARHNNFLREALTWRSLSHESVLPFLGIYEEGETFLVSPFMKHGNLSQWRSNHNPVAKEIRKRLLEVAEGLQYIHSEGIVHGDIRGSNILLDESFHAKIADFGLTRHFDATATQTETLSPNFAAPELFGFVDDEISDSDDEGAKVARTPRSDVYAFGCLCYEIHFNVIPFTGHQYIQIMKQVTQKKRPGRLDQPPLSDEEWKLVKRCWRQEPTKRPTMEDIMEIMLQWNIT